MDGGGSNSSRHYIFKQDLQALADEIGIKIRIAHYPPYTSKWNPIEHRLFTLHLCLVSIQPVYCYPLLSEVMHLLYEFRK
jgi:hypothetical protein